MKYCKIANSIKDTEKIAFEVAQFCKDKKRVAILLNGGLGAGKTTFTKYFANFFGCF
ncbi:MAG: tRNA (adenosine(37)-N6)-threonylcarbamoyltransferase complex ATPase subunit type 1 TsaE, partial [Deferribacterales bacterium]|nr:tRNA (adenosine(37)-N6)-threonylcarbamoyltransferase complex ATPase subunit type 1 TsaE [Deferribacterales bacterium]